MARTLGTARSIVYLSLGYLATAFVIALDVALEAGYTIKEWWRNYEKG